MVTWDDIVTSVEGFFEWLSGLGAGFTDSLGELGSWLFGGLQWVGDRFKEALDYFSDLLSGAIKWLADRLKEAYETLATWLAPAIQWIGSGLSWIGQNLYAFGQWLYNGIVWIANAVWEMIVSAVNWILEQLANAWNTIVSYANGFINSFNQAFNEWVKKLRTKFKQLMLVNLTVPTTMNAFEELVKKPSLKGFLGIVSAPILGAIAVELLDVIIPTPESEIVKIYYPFELPMWTYTPYSPTKPDYFAPPEGGTVILPPAVGFRPLVELEASAGVVYDLESALIVSKEFVNAAGVQYELVTGTTQELIIDVVAGVGTEMIPSIGSWLNLKASAASEHEAFVPAFAGLVGEGAAGAVSEISSVAAFVVGSVNRVATEYDMKIQQLVVAPLAILDISGKKAPSALRHDGYAVLQSYNIKVGEVNVRVLAEYLSEDLSLQREIEIGEEITINVIGVTPDGQYVVAMDDSNVYVFRYSDFSLVNTAPIAIPSWYSAKVSRHSNIMVISESNAIRVVSIPDLQTIKYREYPDVTLGGSVDFAYYDQYIVQLSGNTIVRCFRYSDLELVSSRNLGAYGYLKVISGNPTKPYAAHGATNTRKAYIFNLPDLSIRVAKDAEGWGLNWDEPSASDWNDTGDFVVFFTHSYYSPYGAGIVIIDVNGRVAYKGGPDNSFRLVSSYSPHTICWRGNNILQSYWGTTSTYLSARIKTWRAEYI